MELKFRFLDLLLDQLIEGSNVRELLDPPLSLAILSSRSKIRRINFTVRTIFTHERSRSGPPQVRDGLVDSTISNSRFVLKLRLHLGSLEGGDLHLELIIELLQHLLLTGGFLAVESCLLLVTI